MNGAHTLTSATNTKLLADGGNKTSAAHGKHMTDNLISFFLISFHTLVLHHLFFLLVLFFS